MTYRTPHRVVDIDFALQELARGICTLHKVAESGCAQCGDRHKALEIVRQILEDHRSLAVDHDRMRTALDHIAAGNISPAMGFARRVLDGATPVDAHWAETAR